MFHKKIEASEMQTLKRGRIAPARSVHSVIPNPADSRTKKKIFPDTPFHRQPSMKAIDVLDFDIIKCGVEFVTGVGARPAVDDLLPHMERNENYVYWMQLKGGSTDEQQACIRVNGTYYALNNKLEKAIFRNVRLTRDFKNFERLVDGTRKLVIPQRLFQEKLRTSNRVRTRVCILSAPCIFQ
jgi:hypothetical protein